LVVQVLRGSGRPARRVDRVHAVVANHWADFPEARVAHAEPVVASAAALPVFAAQHVAWKAIRGEALRKEWNSK